VYMQQLFNQYDQTNDDLIVFPYYTVWDIKIDTTVFFLSIHERLNISLLIHTDEENKLVTKKKLVDALKPR